MCNILLKSDSYKLSHYLQYPKNTQYIYSYLESRGGEWDNTVFFGPQYIIKKFLLGQVVTKDKIEEAAQIASLHFANDKLFNRTGWEYILKQHNGYLPIRIKAAPEGSVINTHNVLMTVENTDSNCYWLTNYLETLLVQTWYPTTVCTQSYYMKKIIHQYLEDTGDVSLIDFKLHDFGYRGSTSVESAGIGGCAHLVNFKGTDTLEAIMVAKKYYNEPMAGFSIPAAEHSTITSWGKDHEIDAMKNMLTQYPNGLVAVVSDSFNIFHACEQIWGDELHDNVLNHNGTVVIRPDCYDDKTEILTDTGFKLFSDLSNNDKVAQYNSNNSKIEFVKPIKYYNNKYNGEMIQFIDKKHRIDLLVTPNHRMIVYNKKTNKYITQNAIDFNKTSYGWTFLQASKNDTYIHNKFNYLTPLERLFIAFQADGSFPSKITKNPIGDVCIRFNFVKQRKADRLIKICIDGGFKYTISREPARPQNYNIYVWLKQFPSKTFDWIDITNISTEWAREFIEELSYWDATRRSDTRYKYDTTIKNNADIIQSICIIAGYSCYYSIYQDNRKPQFSDIYSLLIRTNSYMTGLQGLIKKSVNYTGNIYCVQVPTGMIIIRRNNKVLICGNSGEPTEVLPRVMDILGKRFGYTVNEKGYKVLNPQVRVIQGDGIDIHSLKSILECLKIRGWSADNIAFGSGGGLLQKLNRDTLKFAFKCSSAIINGEERDVFKEPITDSGKMSKRGRLKLIRTDDNYKTVNINEHGEDILRTIFINGELIEYDSFDKIRKRVQ